MNSIFDMFGGQVGFNQQLSNFAKQYSQMSNGISPQQMVQQLLNTGRMSQAQFNQFREIANRITGRNF